MKPEKALELVLRYGHNRRTIEALGRQIGEHLERCRGLDGKRLECDKFVSLSSHPYWGEEYEYRRKPRTLTYSVTIPEPLRNAPEVGSIFYAPAPLSEGLTSMGGWYGDDVDYRLLKRGLCFATQEDAIAAAKAMLPIKEAFNER